MWKFLTVEGLPMLFRSYFGYADRSILERLSISSRVWSAISSLSQPRSSTTSTKISERGSTLLLLLTLIWSSEAIVIMEMETYFIPGLVLYTISNEDLRESLRSFIKNELQGEKINESSYSLRKTGYTDAKDLLESFFNEHLCSFSKDDFIRVCYSAALTNDNSWNHRDDIIVYQIN